jgi:hypothetical protein
VFTPTTCRGTARTTYRRGREVPPDSWKGPCAPCSWGASRNRGRCRRCPARRASHGMARHGGAVRRRVKKRRRAEHWPSGGEQGGRDRSSAGLVSPSGQRGRRAVDKSFGRLTWLLFLPLGEPCAVVQTVGACAARERRIREESCGPGRAGAGRMHARHAGETGRRAADGKLHALGRASWRARWKTVARAGTPAGHSSADPVTV